MLNYFLSHSDTHAFRGVSSNDFPCLENLCKKIIKEKQPFERLEVKKETLLEMFKVRVFTFDSARQWEVGGS